jgi:hypothetical protein
LIEIGVDDKTRVAVKKHAVRELEVFIQFNEFASYVAHHVCRNEFVAIGIEVGLT